MLAARPFSLCEQDSNVRPSAGCRAAVAAAIIAAGVEAEPPGGSGEVAGWSSSSSPRRLLMVREVLGEVIGLGHLVVLHALAVPLLPAQLGGRKQRGAVLRREADAEEEPLQQLGPKHAAAIVQGKKELRIRRGSEGESERRGAERRGYVRRPVCLM